MTPRNLEEILEECLSAYLDGRRGVDESLSLYPGLAEELEPLLRTALEVNDGARDWTPSEQLQEQVRQRFLAAAARRRRERMPVERERGWRWGFSFSRSFTAAAATAALAVVALTMGAMALLGNSDDGSDNVLVEILPSPSPSSAPALTPEPSAAPTATEAPPPAAVVNIATHVEQARSDLTALEEVVERGDPIQQEEIGALAETTREIAAQLDDDPAVVDETLDEGEKEALVSVISDGFALLSSLDESELSEGELEDVRTALALTEEIANKLGIPLLLPTPTPEATPTPEPTPSPTPEATPTPAPSETPVPDLTTPAPTAIPEPTPTPPAAASGAVLF
jgi:hypothetical protein